MVEIEQKEITKRITVAICGAVHREDCSILELGLENGQYSQP